jgi:hypothetical protein
MEALNAFWHSACRNSCDFWDIYAEGASRCDVIIMGSVILTCKLGINSKAAIHFFH